MFAELQASVQLTISLKDDGLFLTAHVADFIVRSSTYESRGDVLHERQRKILNRL